IIQEDVVQFAAGDVQFGALAGDDARGDLAARDVDRAEHGIARSDLAAGEVERGVSREVIERPPVSGSNLENAGASDVDETVDGSAVYFDGGAINVESVADGSARHTETGTEIGGCVGAHAPRRDVDDGPVA